MLDYLRARLHERSTWIGLALALVAIGGMIWYARIGYKTGALAALGAALAAAPEHLRWLWPIVERFATVRAQKSTAAPTPEPVAMSLSSDILAEVEKQIVPLFLSEFSKIVAGMGPAEQAAFADIQSVAASPTALGVLKLGADLLAVLHDVTAKLEASEAARAALPVEPAPAA